MTTEQIGLLVVQILVWSLAGILALFVARMAYKLITPFDERKELTEDKNVAVGVSIGLHMVGAAIILHGLIEGERLATTWWEDALLTAALFLMGLALLWVGRMALRFMVKFDLDEEIHVKDNVAVGVLEGCSYVGIAIIVHAAL